MSMIKDAIELVTKQALEKREVTFHHHLAGDRRNDVVYYEVGGEIKALNLPPAYRRTECESLDDLALILRTLKYRNQLDQPTISVGLDTIVLYPDQKEPESHVSMILRLSDAFVVLNSFVRQSPFGRPSTMEPRGLFDLLDQVFTPSDYSDIEALKAYVQKLSNSTVTDASEEHDRSTASARQSIAKDVKGANPDFDAERMAFAVRMWNHPGLDFRDYLELTIRPALEGALKWSVWVDRESVERYRANQLIYLKKQVVEAIEGVSDVTVFAGTIELGTVH